MRIVLLASIILQAIAIGMSFAENIGEEIMEMKSTSKRRLIFMYTKRQKVNIDDTRFIFTTNFSGDPSRDRFGSDKRRVNVVIPTMELVNHLMDLGVKVRQTNPNPERTYDEPFVPTYFVPVTINMDSKWPPHIYWVTTSGKRLLCNMDTISQLDFIRVKNVCLQGKPCPRSGTHPASTACMRM